jgi:hypothetical protein
MQALMLLAIMILLIDDRSSMVEQSKLSVSSSFSSDVIHCSMPGGRGMVIGSLSNLLANQAHKSLYLLIDSASDKRVAHHLSRMVTNIEYDNLRPNETA